jgi:ABC-type lipoprotein release transport system permease subunit
LVLEMNAVWIRARAEVAGRWKALVGLGVLVGLLGAAVMAAAAGARRTESAYERFLADTRAPQVTVGSSFGSKQSLDLSAVARLPQVAEARELDYFGFYAMTPTGTTFTAFGDAAGQGGPSTYWGRSFNRPRVLSGRLADRDRPDEIVVGQALAEKKGLTPGTDVRLQLFDPTNFHPGAKYGMRVVGVVALPGMLPAAPDFTQVLFTPAFYRQNARRYGMSPELLVRLHSEQDVAAFRRAVEAMPGGVGAVGQAPGFDTRVVIEHVTHLVSVTLWMFAGLAALAGLLIIGQSVSRFTFMEAADHDVLRALGMTRKQLVVVAMLKAAVIGLVGAVVAIGISVAVSPLLPVGIARLAEPNPGISVDASVVLVGAAVMMLAVVGVAAAAATRAERAGAGIGVTASAGSVEHPPAISTAAARIGLRAPQVIGLRMAFDPGRGQSAVPVRSAFVAVVIATLAFATNAAFLTSYSHWRATPRLYGWNWDAMVGGAAGAPDVTPGFMKGFFAHEPEVGAWSAGTVSIEVPLSAGPGDSTVVNVWGIDPMKSDGPGGAVVPTVLEGRWPSASNEVALGTQTMRDLGVAIGDRVTLHATGTSAPMTVVGRAVFPELGDGQAQGLGMGAGFTWPGARRLLPDAEEKAFFVRFRPGTDVGATITRLNRTRPIDGIVKGSLAGTDIGIYSGVDRIPIALGSILALAAMATLAHVLITAVNRRRRDLAILKTLGFARGQVQAAVAWHATAFTAAALLVGVPLGIAAGRWWWTLFSGQLGIVPDVVVPVVQILILIPAGILLANLVAAVPARIAARTRPARVLRTE